MQVYATFNRMLLKDIHKQVKRVYPSLDLRKALGVHKQPHGRYIVEGSIPGGMLRWHGRAADANHAKYEAWAEHMRKLGKGGNPNL
jgi:hypothetical protein